MNENLPIDPSQLDEEWLQQPLLFDEAQQEAADCLKARDELKDESERVRAVTANNIRENYEKLGLKKAPAQGVVDDMLLSDPVISELQSKILEANYQLNLANNAVRTLDMRKSALAKLTDLWISNYFSTPNPNHLIEEGKRFIKSPDIDAKSAEATEKLNERKKARTTRDGKTKEEVLASIKNPETREAAKVAIEKKELKKQLDGINQDAKEWADNPDNKEAKEAEPKPRQRRTRRS